MKKIYVIRRKFDKGVTKICITKKSALNSMKTLTKDRYIYEVWPVSTVGTAFEMDAREWKN